MAAIAKIIFPAPPQTTNMLSYQDRQQLMRSTKKLGRVLGITPQLMDIYPSGSSSSSSLTDWSDDDDFFDIPRHRGSVDSLSSGSSFSTQSRSRWSSRPSSRQQSRTTSPASRSSLSTSPAHQDRWLTSDAKPLLRLAMSSPSIDLTFGSPNAESSCSDDEVESNAGDLRYTIRPHLPEASRDSFLSVPDFQIPSTKSLRLAKMDRIRKKLGDDVPVHLVFPDGDAVDSAPNCSSPDSYASVTIHWRPLPAIPKDDASTTPTSATFPSHTYTRTKLSNARDSILVQNSRQAHKIKRKPVPKLDSLEELALNSPFVDVERRKAKERLSLILELPHEHDDNSDLPTVESDDESSPVSGWFGDRADMDCYQNFLNHDTATD